MNVLLLEDDAKISNMIKSLLEKYFSKSITLIDTAANVQQALTFLNDTHYQLCLFDIHLGNETSFDVFKHVHQFKAKVIFITGHEKYALPAIKHQAIDYILKPINITEFKASIQKAIELIKSEKDTIIPAQFKQKQENSLLIKAVDEMRLVKLNDIIYLEAFGAYTDIHLTNNTKINVTKHLKDFEIKLVDAGFYRVHNSYIINTLKIKSISKKDGYSVDLINNVNIMISTRKKDGFINFIENNLGI